MIRICHLPSHLKSKKIMSKLKVDPHDMKKVIKILEKKKQEKKKEKRIYNFTHI